MASSPTLVDWGPAHTHPAQPRCQRHLLLSREGGGGGAPPVGVAAQLQAQRGLPRLLGRDLQGATLQERVVGGGEG